MTSPGERRSTNACVTTTPAKTPTTSAKTTSVRANSFLFICSSMKNVRPKWSGVVRVTVRSLRDEERWRAFARPRSERVLPHGHGRFEPKPRCAPMLVQLPKEDRAHEQCDTDGGTRQSVQHGCERVCR